MPARESRGAARLSGPLPNAACGRAEGPRRGPWPGPQPVGREPHYKPPLSLASRAGGWGWGSGDMPSPRPRKQVGRRRGRLARTRLRKPTVERGAPQQAGTPAPSAGTRETSASRLGPRRASRPRRGQSGQHPSSKTRPPGTSGLRNGPGPAPD